MKGSIAIVVLIGLKLWLYVFNDTRFPGKTYNMFYGLPLVIALASCSEKVVGSAKPVHYFYITLSGAIE